MKSLDSFFVGKVIYSSSFIYRFIGLYVICLDICLYVYMCSVYIFVYRFICDLFIYICL